MNKGLLWFRTDLRLSDNLALKLAMEESVEIVPVYIIEEKWLQKDEWGFDRTGAFRLQFLLESLQDLKTHLQELGSNLIIKKGKAAELIPQLAIKYDCDTVYCSKEYTYEEIKIEEKLESQITVEYVHNSPMIHPDDVKFRIERMPEVFTSFRQKVEKYSEVRPTFLSPKAIKSPELEDTPVPTLQDFGIATLTVDKRAVLPFKGGALAAWNRLDHYFWDTECLSEYKETRNGLIGADYSSKFSPWLAHGCISARSIYAEVEKYEQEVERNKSTYWMKFELLWRDFFKYTAMRYGSKIFLPSGIKDKPKKWHYNAKKVNQWIEGETGDPFVDANMKELKLT
ncbi:MAG: DASH family cryptochrome, partial [Bacteroidota bacterium]